MFIAGCALAGISCDLQSARQRFKVLFQSTVGLLKLLQDALLRGILGLDVFVSTFARSFGSRRVFLPWIFSLGDAELSASLVDVFRSPEYIA